ncbi:MAG TPA: response regulator [Nitrospirales bacterium]|nr:response regulator [Nitrospirales bacterium]
MLDETQNLTILMAEDNPHDVLATKRAWEQFGFRNHLNIVSDGEECLDYIFRQGKYQDSNLFGDPDVILLDLKLPKLDGHQVLKTIRADNQFRFLPVMILTNSTLETDRNKGYEYGCTAFLKKPVGYANFANLLKSLRTFWSCVEPYAKPLRLERNV